MLSTIEPNKQFQVRPKNAFDRERLIIAIWRNGYVFNELAGMMKVNPNYKHAFAFYKKQYRKYPYFGFFTYHGSKEEYKHIVCGFSKKYAKAKVDEYPVVSVDYAIDWMLDNPGPGFQKPDRSKWYCGQGEYDDPWGCE